MLMRRGINLEIVMIRTASFVALLSAAITGCATDTKTQPAPDELAGETGDGEAAKADAAHDTFGFIEVHRFTGTSSLPIYMRPQYTLTRANRTTIKCNDGQYHSQCDLHAVSWEAMGLSQTQIDKLEATLDGGGEVLVRGQYKIYVDFLAFEPSEVWAPQLADGTDDGTFVQVFERGIECITAPCPTVEEDKLNSTRTANTEGLDFGDMTSSLQDKIQTAMGAEGAIVVGTRETRSAVSFVDTLRTVNQVYLPVK